jgi:hypothetical protein
MRKIFSTIIATLLYIVGELPPGAQIVTVFAAGVPMLASPKAYAAIKKSGLEPAKSGKAAAAK